MSDILISYSFCGREIFEDVTLDTVFLRCNIQIYTGMVRKSDFHLEFLEATYETG